MIIIYLSFVSYDWLNTDFRWNNWIFDLIVTEARKLADKYKCKYVETSVVLNHNIDELLVGIVRQARYQQGGFVMSGSTESIPKNRNKVARFTNILIDKIMNIGHKEIPCTNLFDVWTS